MVVIEETNLGTLSNLLLGTDEFYFLQRYFQNFRKPTLCKQNLFVSLFGANSVQLSNKLTVVYIKQTSKLLRMQFPIQTPWNDSFSEKIIPYCDRCRCGGGLIKVLIRHRGI